MINIGVIGSSRELIMINFGGIGSSREILEILLLQV